MSSAEPSGTEVFCPECGYETVVFGRGMRMPICPECGERREREINQVGEPDPIDTVEMGGPRLREDTDAQRAAVGALDGLNVDSGDP